MNAFILRLLHAPHSEQVIFIERSSARQRIQTDFPYEAYEQLRDHSRTLAGMFAFDDANISVTVDGQPEMVSAEFDNASVFPLLGAHALLGRVFTADDDG